MDKDQQMKINQIESRLKETFSDEAFSAYAKLKLVRWAGECMDVYANKIWQLVRRVGFARCSFERVMKLVFVTEFPSNNLTELQQAIDIKTLTIGDLLIWARVLLKIWLQPHSSLETRAEFRSKRSLEQPSPDTDAEARFIWSETVQQDSLIGQAPKNHARRCDSSTSIRSTPLP